MVNDGYISIVGKRKIYFFVKVIYEEMSYTWWLSSRELKKNKEHLE